MKRRYYVLLRITAGQEYAWTVVDRQTNTVVSKHDKRQSARQAMWYLNRIVQEPA